MIKSCIKMYAAFFIAKINLLAIALDKLAFTN